MTSRKRKLSERSGDGGSGAAEVGSGTDTEKDEGSLRNSKRQRAVRAAASTANSRRHVHARRSDGETKGGDSGREDDQNASGDEDGDDAYEPTRARKRRTNVRAASAARTVDRTSRSPAANEAALPRLAFTSGAAFRAWLDANHATSGAIFLVFVKAAARKGTANTFNYKAALDEALCYGWIDSKARRLDDEKYEQLWTQRKPKSVWSRVNKDNVARLRAAGLMQPAGERAIEIAKANGSFASLDDVEALVVPPELDARLTASSTRRARWDALANSRKKSVLYGLNAAKRAETRAKRVSEAIAFLDGSTAWPHTFGSSAKSKAK